MTITRTDLAAWLRLARRPDPTLGVAYLEADVRREAGIPPDAPNPLDVPLHDVRWTWKRNLLDDDGNTLPVRLHRVDRHLIVPLDGVPVLAVPGDWVIASGDTYALLAVGEDPR